jgi:hypothetical protein
MAGDVPHEDEQRESDIEAAEEQRRRLDSNRRSRPGHELDEVREQLRRHDSELRSPEGEE